MSYSKIVELVSKEVDLPVEVVDKTYKAFWKFIKDKILSLPLKDDIDLENFSKLKTNFNIPSLGKLNCTYDRMKRVKLKYKYINNNERNKD